MKSTGLAMPANVARAKAVTAPAPTTEKRRGKFWMAIGTVIALFGVALYSTTMLVGDVNQEPVRFFVEGLTAIGAGLAVWLYGTFTYLMALTELGPSDDSL